MSTVDRARVVVPLLVLDELDKAERRSDKVDANPAESVRTRARETLKELEGSCCVGEERIYGTWLAMTRAANRPYW